STRSSRSSRLALLAADGFLGVLDSLALVGLGRAQFADLRRHQTDAVLVGALHGQPVALGVVLGGDALRQRVHHRMGEAERQVDLLALQLRLVADAGDVQRAGEPLGHAVDHVRDQRPRQAVKLTGAARVVGPIHADLAVLHGDLHLAVELLRDLALGAFDVHQARLGGHLDLVRNLDGELADARHGGSLPDGGDQLAAEVLLARLAIDEHALGSGEDGDPQAVHHLGNLGVPHVPAQARFGLAPDLADRRTAALVVLEQHLQGSLPAVVGARHLAHEAFVAQHLADPLLDVARGQVEFLQARALCVADPRQQICNRTGHAHLLLPPPAVPKGAPAFTWLNYQDDLMTPVISPRSARFRKQMRHIWNLFKKARLRPQSSQR